MRRNGGLGGDNLVCGLLPKPSPSPERLAPNENAPSVQGVPWSDVGAFFKTLTSLVRGVLRQVSGAA